ncbi:MAG: twin-arginine translocase TatA/TatE family subunit [Candidatus Puniceispirillales bacterium WSBS_2018_MAG_OTU23]
MGAFGIWQWIVVLAIILILFARPGKISGIMGDLGKGLRKFKTGMKDDKEDDDQDGDIEIIADAVQDKPVPKKKSAQKKPASKKAKKSTKTKG